MTLPRYPRYEGSGIEWIGEVPAHWSIERLKKVVRFSGGGTPSRDNPDYWNGDIPWISPKDMKSEAVVSSEESITTAGLAGSASSLIPPGRLLMVVRSGILKHTIPVGINRIAVALNQDMKALHPVGVRADFLLRWVQGLNDRLLLVWAKQGATVESIEHDYLANTLIPCPPEEEQLAIAAFLDRETAKIDALIAGQERLLALLAEKRQTVISRAVTKGLNLDAPMKDSGVSWLGEVPAHWGVEQSRRLFCVRSEPAWPEDRMLTASQKYGVLYQADFVEREGRRVVEVILGKESLKHVEPDDFIISMRSFQGGLEWCQLRGSTSFHYVMITPVKHVYPRFFFYLFKSLTYIQALRSTTDLIRDGQELRYSNFVQVPLPVIPLEEQVQIADHLDAEIAKIDSLSHEAARAVLLLRERRSALIAAAVTGQFDVRDIAW